ncbi:hypothetical protein CRENBAI_001457 [Crenichthys baileyi]|uniref:Uncharacterized protein n=1 Tax=Crenichthys baileyi TaxID=28760 RepID=A0AAV9R8C6_9TELE
MMPPQPSAGGGRQSNWEKNITVGQCLPPHALKYCRALTVTDCCILGAQRSVIADPSSQHLLCLIKITAPHKPKHNNSFHPNCYLHSFSIICCFFMYIYRFTFCKVF